MSVCWKPLVSVAALVCIALGSSAGVLRADPIRVTVDFTVADGASAHGSFSIVTETPAGGGQLEDYARGLGADAVSFTWAGRSWTGTSADVPQLVFDGRGGLVYWQLAGMPAGLSDIATRTADFYVDPFSFLYTSPDRRSKVMTGSVVSSHVTMTDDSGTPRPVGHPGPSPVPEPASLALVASGLLGLIARATRPARPAGIEAGAIT